MLKAGQRIGRFEVRAPIGQGGMGAVYVGFDPSLGREVALKVMHEDLTKDPVAVERFRREALALAKLAHPGVVGIYDLVEGDGQLVLVMEHLVGRSLRQRMNDGPIPVDEAVALARQLLAALEAAHGLGVLHRDLKPANVFVTARGEVKLLDFGVARLADATRMTETGELLGTVKYMAPELLRGSEPSARSDVYAVGFILFEMLAGRPPYEGTGIDLVVKIRAGAPPRLGDVAPHVPTDVAAAVDRALSADPAARFESASALLHALPTSAAPHLAAPQATALEVATPDVAATREDAPPEASRPRRPSPRRAAWLVAAGALVLLAAIGVASAAAVMTAPGRRRATEVRTLALVDAPPPSSEPSPSAAPSTLASAPPVASSSSPLASSAPPAPTQRIEIFQMYSGFVLGESNDRTAAEKTEKMVLERVPAIRRCVERSPERFDRVSIVLDDRRGNRCDVRTGMDYHPFPCCAAVVADLRLPGDIHQFDLALTVKRTR